MTDPYEIEKLAFERLSEAEILYENHKFDGAFYLAGYSIELMLKAKICENFGVPNLFDENVANSNVKGIGDVRKAVKTHNLYVLLILSGLMLKFDSEKSENKHLFKANSLMFGNWDENSRYKPCGFHKPTDVSDLISLLKHENGLLQWIKNN